MQDQEAIKNFLEQPTIKSALVLLTLRYNINITELLKLILNEDLDWNDIRDFLQTEYGILPRDSQELQERMIENFKDEFNLFLEDKDDFINNYSDEVIVSDEQMDKIIAAEERKMNKEKWLNFLSSTELAKNINDLEKAAGQNWPAIYDYLWNNLGLTKIQEVLIILHYLAINNKLTTFWQEDRRFHGILQKQLSFSYSLGLVKQLLQQPLNCLLLARALKMLLADKLELNKHDSAMIALSIINSLPTNVKRQFLPSVYWDEKNQEWEWSELVLDKEGKIFLEE